MPFPFCCRRHWPHLADIGHGGGESPLSLLPWFPASHLDRVVFLKAGARRRILRYPGWAPLPM